jgi:dCMP deaminase
MKGRLMSKRRKSKQPVINKWDKRFLRLAKEVSTWSKDPSTQTGAVFVSPDKKDIILGFNGFASNMDDDPSLYLDREVKYSRIIHCEMNALIIAKRPVANYTLYTWPFLSCDRCAVHMAQAGIKRVVAPLPSPSQAERWEAAFKKTRGYFREAKIEVVEFDINKIDI